MTQIELIARAIIINEGKILLCQSKGVDYYFLPGGHVEFGETAKQALEREFEEELGMCVKNAEYIGVIENIFSQKRQNHHEINLVFSAEPEQCSAKSKEAHIEFFWKDIDALAGKDIKPTALKNALIQWLSDKKSFWGSEREQLNKDRNGVCIGRR